MATHVTTKRPEIVRCYVKVINPKTNKSTTITLYGIDAERLAVRLPELAATLAAAS
jgi:hypothetical protein